MDKIRLLKPINVVDNFNPDAIMEYVDFTRDDIKEILLNFLYFVADKFSMGEHIYSGDRLIDTFLPSVLKRYATITVEHDNITYSVIKIGVRLSIMPPEWDFFMSANIPRSALQDTHIMGDYYELYNAPTTTKHAEKLIGIEWEIQLTLLNHPNNMIVPLPEGRHISSLVTDCFPISNAEIYALGRVGTDFNGCDCNFEIRSNPVKIEDLDAEIKLCDSDLAKFTKKIAKVYGPVGVFLPASKKSFTNYSYSCWNISKHVSVSYAGFISHDHAESIYVLRRTILYKDDERLHIRVPYNFIEYPYFYEKINNDMTIEDVRHIESYSLSQKEMHKPILLGWSMSGDEYIRHNPLI